MPTDHEFITLSEKTQCPVHLISDKVHPAMFSLERQSGQDTFFDREGFHQDIKQFREKVNLPSGSPIQKKLSGCFFEKKRDHQLAEAKSEILKQKCTLNTCIREFQRQANSNWLENCGYEETRREQARHHEELAPREKALRETRIRTIHEVKELKRAQETRIDEFSRNEWRESHAIFQELTSQKRSCRND